MVSRRRIRRALEELGWEVRWRVSPEAEDPDAVAGGYGPYRLRVRFDPGTGQPTSVLTHRAGSQGVFAERWRGVEQLPTPKEIVRRLSRRDADRS